MQIKKKIRHWLLALANWILEEDRENLTGNLVYITKEERKEEKEKGKIASWVSRDKEIDDARIAREKEEKERLPHPVK